MLVHRIYCCLPERVDQSGIPQDANDLLYWDIMNACTGDEAIVLFHEEVPHYVYLAWELVDEEAPFYCTQAVQYIKQRAGKPSKPKPVVCPEIWFEGKTDGELAMKAMRDLSKGTK